MGRRSSVTGRYMRQSKHDQVHSMLMTWASHIRLLTGTSEGQGYTIGILQDYSGLPPHSLIPKGIEFTSPDDRAIDNFLSQTTEKYRELVKIGYLEGKRLNRYSQKELLTVAAKWLYS